MRIVDSFKKLPTKTKLAIGLGALAVIFLARRKSVEIFGQAYNSDGSHAPWAGITLGFGSSTIGGAGCVLVALNMAYNHFKLGTPFDPGDVNDLCKSGGCFSGSSLFVEKAANLLSMTCPAGQHLTAPADGDNIISVIDACLARGGVALLRVFHGGDRSNGDHTVLIFSGSGGSYQAADPALARVVTFTKSTVGAYTNLVSADGTKWSGGGGHVPYSAVGVAALYPAA